MKKDRTSDTIPRLDKVDYLFQTLECVAQGQTLEETRLSLIELRRELYKSTKEDLRAESRSRVIALENPLPSTFWANTRDSMRELMKLGMVVHAPVPHTFEKFGFFRDRVYKVTSEGGDFIQLGHNPERVWEFRDRFACALEVAHPYLRRIISRLSQREIFIPRIVRDDIPGDVDEWREAPPGPLHTLSHSLTELISKATDEIVDASKLEQILQRKLNATWGQHKPPEIKKAASRWVVKTMNDQLIGTVAEMNSVPIDSIAFRYGVSLLSDLHVLWGTRALPNRPAGWSIWATANGARPQEIVQGTPAKVALELPVWLRRKVPDDTVVADHLLEAFATDSNRKGGFSLIHEIRARVCHDLGIHGWVFDEALRKLVLGEVALKNSSIHIDAGGSDKLPPSETAFALGNKQYYLLTILSRRDS